jgi:hypothetical protein
VAGPIARGLHNGKESFGIEGVRFIEELLMQRLDRVEAERLQPLMHVGTSNRVLLLFHVAVVLKKLREGRVGLENADPAGTVASDDRGLHGLHTLGQNSRQDVVALPQLLDRGRARTGFAGRGNEVLHREVPDILHAHRLGPPATAKTERGVQELGNFSVVRHGRVPFQNRVY